jgi:hypothetical protein
VDNKEFFGVELTDEPVQILKLVESILSPDMPESLEAILSSLPPRPRYIGPEAWLDAFARSAEGREGAQARVGVPSREGAQESEERAKRR